MDPTTESRSYRAKDFGEITGRSGYHLHNGFEAKGRKGKTLRMSGNIIHRVFVKGVESILEMGESCPLIFKSWFMSELEAGWYKITWMGRDFTRVVYNNEMVMRLGVNSRSAQCPLP